MGAGYSSCAMPRMAQHIAVRAETLGDHAPATTTVVAAPFDPRLLVEVQVIAYREAGSAR